MIYISLIVLIVVKSLTIYSTKQIFIVRDQEDDSNFQKSKRNNSKTELNNLFGGSFELFKEEQKEADA